MPVPVLGERTCAFIIPRPGKRVTVKELADFLIECGIAKYKLPERVELVDDFPLSPFGKVSKRTLTTMIAEKLAQETRSA
jgi:non-ribosomal peptide synthetase component E (peptide arylation enzyme)